MAFAPRKTAQAALRRGGALQTPGKGQSFSELLECLAGVASSAGQRRGWSQAFGRNVHPLPPSNSACPEHHFSLW